MNDMRVEMLWAASLACYLMALVDGEITQDEYEALRASVGDMAGEALSPEKLDELISAHTQFISTVGIDGAIAELAKRLPVHESRKAALLYAAGIAFADGVVKEQEIAAFHRIANSLGFSDEEADELVESALEDGE